MIKNVNTKNLKHNSKLMDIMLYLKKILINLELPQPNKLSQLPLKSTSNSNSIVVVSSIVKNVDKNKMILIMVLLLLDMAPKMVKTSGLSKTHGVPNGVAMDTWKSPDKQEKAKVLVVLLLTLPTLYSDIAIMCIYLLLIYIYIYHNKNYNWRKTFLYI